MKKKGMTLVELILTIAILGIIMSFVAIALRPVIQNYGANKSLVESKDIANTTLALIKNEIRDAKGVVDTTGDIGSDVRIYSDGKAVHGIDLPSDYFKNVKSLKLSFTVTGTDVTVLINVDGYQLNGTYAPYKPDVTKAGYGTNLYILKKAPTSE